MIKNSNEESGSAQDIVCLDLLKRTLGYIEEREEMLDDEWGGCRSFDELLAEGYAPKIYCELAKLIKQMEASEDTQLLIR